MNKSIYLYLALTHENICYAKNIIVHIIYVFKKNRVQQRNSFQPAATVCAVWDISWILLSTMGTDGRRIFVHLCFASYSLFLNEIDQCRKNKRENHKDRTGNGQILISFFDSKPKNQKNDAKHKEQQGKDSTDKIDFLFHFLFSRIMESR